MNLRGVPNALIQGYMLRRDEIQRRNEERRRRDQELEDRKEQWSRLDRKTEEENIREDKIRQENRTYAEGREVLGEAKTAQEKFQQGDIENQKQMGKNQQAINLWNMMKADGRVKMPDLKPGEAPSEAMLTYWGDRLDAIEAIERGRKTTGGIPSYNTSAMVDSEIRNLQSMVREGYERGDDITTIEATLNEYLANPTGDYQDLLLDLQEDDKTNYYKLREATQLIKRNLKTSLGIKQAPPIISNEIDIENAPATKALYAGIKGYRKNQYPPY